MEEKTLIIEQSSKSSSLFMLVLGGQVTLAGTVFENANLMSVAFIAMGFMLLASMLAMAVAEKNVRAAYPKPKFKHKSLYWITGSYIPTSIEAQYIYSFLSGLCFAISMLIYGYFAHVSLT